MGNKVFSSYRTGKNKEASNTQTLIVEIGRKHLACAVKGGSNLPVKDFELFRFDDDYTDFAKAYGNVFEESVLLKQEYDTTQVFINHEASLVMPSTNLSKEVADNYLNLILGEQLNAKLLIDEIANKGISTVYRVSAQWTEAVNKSLKVDFFKHVYSTILEQVLNNTSINESLLKVIFYDSYLIVTLLHKKQLQLIQTFSFQNEDDILYYLLNISQQFNLDRNVVHLQLSGVVDLNGNIFSWLKQQFQEVSLEEIDSNVVQINFGDYSKHYFTPFFNLAK